MRIRQYTFLFLLSFVVANPAFSATKEEKRVHDATNVVDSILRIPEPAEAGRILNLQCWQSPLDALDLLAHDGGRKELAQYLDATSEARGIGRGEDGCRIVDA